MFFLDELKTVKRKKIPQTKLPAQIETEKSFQSIKKKPNLSVGTIPIKIRRHESLKYSKSFQFRLKKQVPTEIELL